MKNWTIIMSILLLCTGATWGVHTYNQNKILKEIESQLESRIDCQFTVTDIRSSKDESGSYYHVTVKMEGVKKPFTFQREKEAIGNLYEYEVIEELWGRQYIQEVSSIFKKHPFEVKNVTGTIGINRKDPIDITQVPNIQEVREKYGKEIIIDHIDIMLNDDYPLDSKQQEKEDEKIFNILKDMKDRDMDNNLSLSIQYTKYTQRYEILINDYQKDKYHSPEDMKKALIKTQKQVEQTYRK